MIADGTHETIVLEHRVVLDPPDAEPAPYADVWTKYAQTTGVEAAKVMLAELRPATDGRLVWRATRVVTTVEVLDL